MSPKPSDDYRPQELPEGNDTQSLSCPVGEAHCVYIDELEELRSHNDKLLELVRTDTLTGIYNYRHFSQALEHEMERSRRSGLPTALILVDLDHFKKVNDTWGHEIGNAALVQTANLMRTAVRKLDIPCRYGGEEFIIILPSTDLLISIQVAERLRKLIVSTPLPIPDGEIHLTASLGVDVFTGEQKDSPEDFFNRVDALLYRAKNEGRNRVCHAVSDLGEAEAQVTREEKDALFALFGNDE